MRITRHPSALQSQKWIFAAFTDVLASIPYGEISVSMLCRRAGIDRRTFYRYFDNKEDVLRAYLDTTYNEYADEIRAMDSTDKTAYVERFFSFWNEEHIGIINALRRDGLLHLAFASDNRYFMEVEDILDEKLGRTADRYARLFCAGGLISVLLAWVAGGRVEPPEEMAALLAKCYNLG